MHGPLDELDRHLSAGVLEIAARETPIPSIAQRAAAIAREHPDFVRADIGQISQFDSDLEVLYGPPVGLPELRAALAETWTLAYRLPDPLGPSNVAVCTGAAEGLSLLLRCFAHGKVVGLPRGYWENYVNAVSLGDGRATLLDYFDESGQLDVRSLTEQVRAEDVSVLLVNFPCNPTGAVLVDEEARALAQLARENDLIMVSDEVYGRLRYDGQPPISLLSYAPERTVVVSSASKEYLLPGARVGFVLSSRTDLTDRVLRRLIRANTASPNVLGQRRLLELILPDLEDLRAGRDPVLLGRVRDELSARRDALVAVLRRHDMIPVGRPRHDPQGTIFLMASLPPWWHGTDEEFVEQALEHRVVSVVQGSAFAVPRAVRFSFGGMTTEAIGRLDAGIARWREELQSAGA